MIQNVLDYLDATAMRVPERPAFSDDATTYTFEQLDASSRAIGSFLAAQDFYREPIVVFMGKHPQTIAAFFGVIRAGCFYVPIDAEMPTARTKLILENCQPRLIICDEETHSLADGLDFNGEVALYEDVSSAAVDEAVLLNIRNKALDIDPIYIVFTSGSTGVPKGVCACHRSVIDYVEQLSSVLEFDDKTVFGSQTPLYFDACMKEIYPTIMFGAHTHLIPRELFSFPVKLVEYLNERRINTICWVVSALTMISAFNTFETVAPQYLHTIAFGSEVFPMKQYRAWRNALPQARFFNLYGPTEATGMSCYYRCSPDASEQDVIPIGVPFNNTEVLLLADDNTLAQPGSVGEICLRGTCLTLGYYNNPEKTAEAFVQNPLNDAYPETIYRTGDLAKYDEQGNLVFVSRKDYMIKHMGYRIELGEIEANVGMVEGVKICCCTYDQDKDRIVLHYVGEIEKADLSSELKTLLPRYMLPKRIYKLDAMPFTPNGKIDRVALAQHKS